MTNEFLDDFEQAEVVKKWLRENGPALAVGLVLGLGGLFGYNYWKTSQAQQSLQTAIDYETVAAQLATDDETTVDDLKIFEDAHGNHAYTGMLSLQMAKNAVDQNNYEQAIVLLGKAAQNAKPESLKTIAKLRLARVYLQTVQLDKASETLTQVSDSNFDGIKANIQGDILQAKGDKAGARAAYQQALDNLQAGGDRNLLEMKINDLAESYSTTDTPNA